MRSLYLSLHLIALTALVFMTSTAHAQNVSSASTPSIQIDIDLMDQLMAVPKPVKPEPVKAKPVAEKSAEPLTPLPKAGQPKQVHKKSRSVLEQEKALLELKKKYFPDQYEADKAKAAQKQKEEAEEKKKEAAAKRAAEWQKRRIAARKKMPPPAIKPGHVRKAAVQRPAPVRQAKPKAVAQPKRSNDLTARPPALSQLAVKKQPPKAQNKQLNSPTAQAVNGDKLVSIAYVDQEVNLNANVQNALKASYVPQLKQQSGKRIGLYSYATSQNRGQQESYRYALERAQALKSYLVNSGIRTDMIDIFPSVVENGSNFSDWIDIMVER